jgi:hypothetical protein
MTGATMRFRHLAFGSGAQPGDKHSAEAKLTIPVFVVGLISTVFRYWTLPQHRFASTAISIPREPVGLTSASLPALPHFMKAFVFGFLEFDWLPGQVTWIWSDHRD